MAGSRSRGAGGLFGDFQCTSARTTRSGLASLCRPRPAGRRRRTRMTLDAKDAGRLRPKRDAIGASGEVRTTYGTGVLLMFITEMFRPEMKDEKKDARYATKPKKDGCGLPKDMASWIQELAGWLVSVQLDDGWWRYPIAPPGDLSNTQYALLGLRAARDCGATVPASCFMRAIDGTLAAQEQDGPKLKRIIKGSGKPGETDYAVEGGDRARGWPYQHGAGGITGSMTTAAIGTLAISPRRPHEPGALRRLHRRPRPEGRPLRAGRVHVARSKLVRRVQPSAGRARTWHYYYLYGLERAACLRRSQTRRRPRLVRRGREVPPRRSSSRTAAGAPGPPGREEIAPSDLCDTAGRSSSSRRPRVRSHPRAGRHDGQMTAGLLGPSDEREAADVAACAAKATPQPGALRASGTRRCSPPSRAGCSNAARDRRPSPTSTRSPRASSSRS